MLVRERLHHALGGLPPEDGVAVCFAASQRGGYGPDERERRTEQQRARDAEIPARPGGGTLLLHPPWRKHGYRKYMQQDHRSLGEYAETDGEAQDGKAPHHAITPRMQDADDAEQCKKCHGVI